MIQVKDIVVQELSDAVNEQIDDTRLVCTHLSRELPNAYGSFIKVAGGAPRDWWFNQPARDVDIFIPYFGDYTNREYAELFGVGELVLLGNDDLGNMYGDTGIHRVYESLTYQTKFNFVIKRKDTNIYEFPTSLSRYAFLPPLFNVQATPRLFRSYGAALGEEMRKIFCRDRDFTPKEMKYLQKIWRKVPDYEILSDTEGLALAKEAGLANQEWRALD